MAEYMKPDDHEHSIDCDRCGKQVLDVDIRVDKHENTICPDCASRCRECGEFYGDHGTCVTVGCPGDDSPGPADPADPGPKGIIIADINDEDGVTWFSDFGGQDHPTFEAKFTEACEIIHAADTEAEMVANLIAAGFTIHDRRGVDVRAILGGEGTN